MSKEGTTFSLEEDGDTFDVKYFSDDNATLDEIMRTCLQNGRQLRMAIFLPPPEKHWHALVPTDGAGRVVARQLPPGTLPLMTAAGQAPLRDDIAAYDASGGYENAAAGP